MQKYRWLLTCLGLLLVVSPPLSMVLLLMPIIPGAQELESIAFTHAIHSIRWPLYSIGIIVGGFGVFNVWRYGRWYGKLVSVIVLVIALAIHALTLTKMSAEAMFNEPRIVQRVPISSAPDVLGAALVVEIHGQVAVYPIDLIAHHHKVMDTVGGTAVMVTYCTMCHTGRVFSPLIDGAVEHFRLVGANKYNAIIEDHTTGSWWYQATGECVVGARSGSTLKDIPFEQHELAHISQRYSQAMAAGAVTMFVPDEATGNRYEWSKGYSLRSGDTSNAISPNTLVLGIEYNNLSLAYSVRELCSRPDLNKPYLDSIGRTVVSITGSSCQGNGFSVTIGGVRQTAYTDAWHAWKTFHPTTLHRRLVQ